MKNDTDFGFTRINSDQKAKLVEEVFSSVSDKYDLMNDLMSLGLHRFWKKFTVNLCRFKTHDFVLDLASGTGDLAESIACKIGSDRVVLADINEKMLRIGRNRMLNTGFNPLVVRCDAEEIPFGKNCFDCVIVGFGVRNMTRKDKALSEIFRILKPGGQIIILEFAEIWKPLKPFYDFYSFTILPLLGDRFVKDSDSYQYLAESIRVHPSRAEFSKMLAVAGFGFIDVFNLSAGLVSIHRGRKC